MDLSRLGHAPKCPHPSMVPMTYKWVTGSDGQNVLACTLARCFGCGVEITFDHGPALKPKLELQGEE